MTKNATTVSGLMPILRKKLSRILSDDFAALETDAILEEVLQIDRARLYMNMRQTKIGADDVLKIEKIIERRLQHEPLQYIFKKVYFYDREFHVNRNVLIPRPDTETLISCILDKERAENLRFADIGTGSGIIGAVLVAHGKNWIADAIDFSFAALEVAKKNICAKNNSNIKDRVRFINCDMLSAVKPGNQYDFIVSNPPYISKNVLLTLDKSVVDYEPHIALDGGVDGLDFYRKIANVAKDYLKNNGRVYLEIGYDQADGVSKIFLDKKWNVVDILKDLGGRDRVFVGELF